MDNQPITIQEQGSFMIGGRTIIKDGTVDFDNPVLSPGQTLHGDHAYVAYQIPFHSDKFPLIFLHGALSSSIAWETTPHLSAYKKTSLFPRLMYPQIYTLL